MRKDIENESYTAKYAAGKLSIKANSDLAQSYAIQQLETAAKAKHLPDFLGENSPRFPLRPLWIKPVHEVRLDEDVSLHVPEFKNLPIKKWIEWGYNSILIGSYHNGTSLPSTVIELSSIFQELNDHGIKILLKPNFTLTKDSFDLIFQHFPKIEALFWEYTPETTNDQTDAENALEQVRMLEQYIEGRSKLIFYMPCPKDAAWMSQLLDDMGQHSILAFNAVSGGYFDDHSADHPFWELLRQSPDTSSTCLMPIINVGLVKQGDGFWPTVNFDLLERFLPRCDRHRFAGVLGLINSIPESGSVLDCNLWVAGQSLWRKLPVTLLAETWFKAHRPNEDAQFAIKVMKLARAITLELSYLRGNVVKAEEAKIYGDNLLTSLKFLELICEKETKAFVYDVKQLFRLFLPTFNMPISFVAEEEPLNSFWNHYT